MFTPHDLAVLSKALTDGLLSIDQFSDIVRKLADQPESSLELLLSKVGLSQDQVSALIASTDDRQLATTVEASDRQAAAPEVGDTETFLPDSSRGEVPDAGLPALSVPAGAPSDAAVLDKTSREGDLQLDAWLRYRIAEEIGHGGLGCVRRARDLYLGRDVAIKELLPGSTSTADRIERFFLEAQLTGQLEHPGIVPVHALGATGDGQPFYTMKLIQGKTLAELIEEHHALEEHDPQRTVGLNAMLRALVDVADAAAFAHSRGVVHRDIKPLNVMVGDYGETLLVDWGLAKMYRDGETRKRQREAAVELGSSTISRSTGRSSSRRRDETRAGTVMGTLAYMSPEQARGTAESLDHRADIFSLGATLYAILVGRPPYFGKQTEMLEQARLGEYAEPREINPRVPRALEAICLRAIALHPDDRYQSAKQLGEEITRWQSGEPVEAYPEPWWDRAGRWIRKHRTFCVSIAVGVLVAALALGAWSAQRRRWIAADATASRIALEKGQRAFDENRLQVAATLFGEAQKHAADRALRELRSLANRWTQKTVSAIQDRAAARNRLEDFRRLHQDAEFYGMLATGVDVEENVERTKEAATAALALFSLRADSNESPLPDPAFYGAKEVDYLHAACRQLRRVYADAVAQPLPERSQLQNRHAAKQALALLELIRTESTSPKAYYLRRAFYLYQAGDEPAAQEALRRAEDEPPRGAEDHFLVGDFQYRGGKYDAAVASFRRALQQAPDHFWARYFLAASLVRLGQWQEAVTELSALVERRQGFIHLYLLRGFAHGELGDLKAAQADFQRAQDIDKSEFGLYLNRGVLRLRHGKLEDAIDDFQKAISLKPESTEAYVNLAEACRLQKQPERALEKLQEVVRLSPHSARPHYLLARIHLDRDDDPAAWRELEQGINKADRGSRLRAALYAEQGRMLARQGKTAEALDVYDRALQERDDYYDAYHLRAIALVELNRNREAIESFDKYLAESPLLAEVYLPGKAISRGLVAAGSLETWETGETARGIDAEAKRALAIVYRERGLARCMVGDGGGALEDFARAAQLVPDVDDFPMDYDRVRFGIMQSRRGWAYLNQGRELARKAFDAAVKIMPDQGEPLTGRGYAYALLGRYREAIADAEEAIRLGPDGPGLYFNAAGIYAEAYARALADEEADDRDAVVKTCRERALHALRRCFEGWPEKCPFYLRQAKLDAALDSIRHSDEFKALLAEFSR